MTGRLRWVMDAHRPRASRRQRGSSGSESDCLPPPALEANPLEPTSEDTGLLVCYFASVAPILGTFNDGENPFGKDLQEVLVHGSSLQFAAMSIAALQLSKQNALYLQLALTHRATAYRLLKRDLDDRRGKLAVLYTVILLGLTEVRFSFLSEQCSRADYLRQVFFRHDQYASIPYPGS